jgi:hypothetical protein
VIHDDRLRSRIHEALDGVHRPAPGLLRRCVDAAEHSGRARRIPALALAAALSALAAAIVVLALLQHQPSLGPNGPLQSPTPSPQQVLYTLDAQNTVSALDAQSLRVLWRGSAGTPPATQVAPTGVLRLSRDSRTLWVLPPSSQQGGTELRSFDAATGTPGATVTLSAPGGAAYTAVAVDPRTGDLAAVGQDTGRVVVTLVDPRGATVLSTTATRPRPAATPAGAEFAVEAVFTADGARLYYSYSSSDPSRAGVDWVSLAGGTVQPCQAQAAGAACIRGLGNGVALAGSTVVATDARDPQQLVEAGPDGAVIRRVATGLAGGTVGDVVVGADGRTASVLGACPSGGGLSRVGLGGGTVQTLATPLPAGAPPDPTTPCGVQAQALSGGAIAATRLDTAFAGPNTPGTVEVVDAATGRVLRQASFAAAVVDLLAAP